jgi:alpha-L-fucosidase
MTMASGQERPYVWPDDPAVRQKLEQWQDYKFGLLMHWGTYSQWGVVESWSLCPEDEGWCERKGPYGGDYFTYKKAYEDLQKTFNPTKFNPDKWAAAASDAGMKYMVFTTKHHDGFCMFDTKQTSYRITDPSCSFSSDPRANVTAEVFKAFRAKGFMTGAYFSKPDWNTKDYWWSKFPPKDRNVNYDPKKYPERWKAFQDFTYNQIEELMTGYGQVDILWLDGGWVRPKSTIDTTVDWQRGITFDQDINMPRIAKMARSHQPGLLVVDRTVAGPYENYATPEQQVPASFVPHPWESCVTMGNSWSYVPGDTYKSSRTIVHLLTTIISRGGSLLLNIGPGPDGEWDPIAYQRLKDVGSWMKVNGEAVYGTRADGKLPGQGQFVFTRKGEAIYAIYQAKEGEAVPEKFTLNNLPPELARKANLLGYPKALKVTVSAAGEWAVELPASLRKEMAGKEAWVVKFSQQSAVSGQQSAVSGQQLKSTAK